MGEEEEIIEEDNEDVLEEAEYGSKSDFSKGEVVRIQVKKCTDIRSKEMKNSYFNYDKFGNKVYIPDSRREWVSAVKALKIILSPEIERSTDCKKKLKQLEILEKGLFEKWAIKENGIKFIPELDQTVELNFRQHRGYMQADNVGKTLVHGIYNENFHGYWNEMVEIYDMLFGELNILIDINSYFKKSGGGFG